MIFFLILFLDENKIESDERKDFFFIITFRVERREKKEAVKQHPDILFL